jgi:hypothetical protein
MSTIAQTLSDIARPALDLGPSHDGADAADRVAEDLDGAAWRLTDAYEGQGEALPDAVLFAVVAVEEAADRLRRAAVLLRGHVGPIDLLF